MAISEESFIADYSSFTKQSMDWCVFESEKEASSIYNVMHTLIDDLKRRSQMTEKTIEALAKMEHMIESFLEDKGKKVHFVNLISELNALKGDNKELDELVNPIIECLQFQDRLRQNLQNIGKMMDLWIKTRQSKNSLCFLEDDALEEFGKKLLTCTTSIEERECIRKIFTMLPAEQKLASQTILF